MAVARWWLYTQAIFWRFLMRIGMFFHHVISPRSPSPTFTRSIPCQDSSRSIQLHFYCPEDYADQRKAGRRLPVVVNFHGGGFALGRATDDARWAQTVVCELGAVVVSVDYRLAPENPFPAAVDDGVDALLHLASNASDLGIDASQVILTGFSAGGNLAVTVPLRLRQVRGEARPELHRYESTQQLLDATNELHVVAIFSWYPILDFVLPREHRRAMSILPEKTLPSFFTNLFDESYVPNRDDRTSPYASPALATDQLLAEALPHNVFLYMCEWDMLLREGQVFVRRLQGLGKKVRAMMIEKVPHAWDKSPNPFRDQDSVNVLYREACAEMKTLLEK
ncbi:hypothetical protein DTO166G4_3508 [Paecilomyces variotii]|uniref:Putative lipase n=1 Tax=Byssochlamys spectabilis TaxID=264951 RepID=A0A443HT19_BYSSP|nr:putative lipase [Paecilomyces variotii]KAJ9199816.1 hypothetical protein DTO032I3_4948 [Paecilomyces variotii]KAJ9207896.1 hypothetical protein DTO164E3_182 [Paecilomyces variotii]KAJ9214916.1 hypothetical protein DTO166G4_3508 [Paecilomyces variotii]KAJ9238404.1 hypothetical protein DTO166G5_2952 [Paecilomyces variotii]KAJ9246137.1 hypothetical protein DTO169E5_261 [Paecilomyces variotii]